MLYNMFKLSHTWLLGWPGQPAVEPLPPASLSLGLEALDMMVTVHMPQYDLLHAGELE